MTVETTADELARRSVDIIAPCLREEEQRDAYVEFRTLALEILRRFRSQLKRQLKGAQG